MIKTVRPGIELKISDDPAAIFTFEADYFVPAAMGDVITNDVAKTLGARIGINEIANGPTTEGAHQHLVESGKIIIPDFLANSGGVDTSITEWKADVDLAEGRIAHLPDDSEVEASQLASTTALTREVLQMAERLETNDMRVAAAAVGLVHLQEATARPISAAREKTLTA
jgi:glutamate dehydrogenase/leucine dehydrogenase